MAETRSSPCGTPRPVGPPITTQTRTPPTATSRATQPASLPLSVAQKRGGPHCCRGRGARSHSCFSLSSCLAHSCSMAPQWQQCTHGRPRSNFYFFFKKNPPIKNRTCVHCLDVQWTLYTSFIHFFFSVQKKVSFGRCAQLLVQCRLHRQTNAICWMFTNARSCTNFNVLDATRKDRPPTLTSTTFLRTMLRPENSRARCNQRANANSRRLT